MFLANKMDRVSILLLRDDVDTALSAIAETGLLHPVRVEDIEAWAEPLTADDVSALNDAYAKLLSRIERVMAMLPSEVGTSAVPARACRGVPAPDTVETALESIERDIIPLLAERDRLLRRAEGLQALRANNTGLLASGIPLDRMAHSQVLTSATGIVPSRNVAELDRALQALPGIVTPLAVTGRNHIVCVHALRQDTDRLDSLLARFGFHETLSADDLGALVDTEEESEQARLHEIEERIQTTTPPAYRQLAILQNETADILELLRLRRVCRHTGTSCLVSGWAPSSQARALVDAVVARTDGRAVAQTVSADTIESVVRGVTDVPVMLEHAPLLEPFEAVVDTYGTPSYRMIDPTPLVSATFLLMFGMMFGDLGHGAVLATAGAVLGKRLPAWRNIGRLLTYCGGSACVFGLLFGSVFGNETLLPALWVRPLEHISTLFATAIGFGVAVISVGILLNTVNALRARDLARCLFEPSGPLGALAYWLGVALAVAALASPHRAPLVNVLLFLLVAVLLGFFMKGPVLKALGRQRTACPHGVPAYLMEVTFEIAEFLMGYLANTVSFIRVAAFGLAHAGLFIAVFGLCDIVAQAPGGGWMSAVIMVFGNVFIIVLEGVVVTIQILRLEYYEFFGKFFNHYGTKYRPVRYRQASVEAAG